jgi:N-acetylmuramic acid 6-phosphate (MurNAc-6-P) etherase
MIGIPITAIARQVRLNASDGASAWYAFQLTSGRLYVRLDASIDPEFALSPEQVEEPAAEGDMMFF